MLRIDPPSSDLLTYDGMIAIVVLVAILASFIFGRGSRRRTIFWAMGFSVVMAASSFVARAGVLASTQSFPPPMGVMIMMVLVGSVSLGMSRVGGSIAQHASLRALVLLQLFRFPLELLMHHAAAKQIMPVQLSFSGFNFDIVTGISAAVLVGASAWRRLPAWTFWIWNVWGIVCLAGIAMIAITTSPMVHAFGTEPHNVNSWVLFFPYVWLPTILVSTAIVSHIAVTRKLLAGEAHAL